MAINSDSISLTAGLIGIGSLVLAIKLRCSFNDSAMQETCAALDRQPTVVFSAKAEDSENRNFHIAKKSALALANRLGNQVLYYDEDDCAANHTEYETVLTPHGGFGGIGVVSKNFVPCIIAFQAAAADPSIAVPLLSSADPKMGVRPDNRLIPLI